MLKFFKKIGFTPKWGISEKIAEENLVEDELEKVRREKMSGKKTAVSKEIKNLLEKQK